MNETNQHSKETKMNPYPWIAATALILVLAATGGYYWNSTSKIRKVTFEGFHRVSEQQLRQQANIPLGVKPDSLNFTTIVRNIEKIPYVRKARLHPEPGGTMVVQITERKPVALLVAGSRRAYIDAEGIRLPKMKGHTPDVPILYGFKVKAEGDTLQSNAFKQTGRFLKDLQERKASDATISEVAWNDEKGVIALTNNQGVKIIFGKNEFDDHLRNWEAFCRAVIRKKGVGKFHLVDLRFKGQIVTREK